MSRREYRKHNKVEEKIDGYTIVNALVGNGVDAVVKIPNTSLNSNETICFASMPTSQAIGYFYCSGKGSLRLMLLDVGTVNNRYDYSFGTNYMTLSVSTPHYARNVRHEFIQKRGSITIDEYENLHDYLYLPYKEMGGNGSAEKVMTEVKKLRVRKSDV